MGIRIEPYRQEYVGAVASFNRRMRAGGCQFEFPESPVAEWLPAGNGQRIYQNLFLALDGEAVRGGYVLKTQDFSFGGEVLPVGYYHLPLSEGIVDKVHGMVGVRLLTDALRRQPLLYALGMGGLDRPLPRMLKAMGWALEVVPFYFRVVRTRRFLRNIGPLRTTALRRRLAEAAAATGAGWVGVRALHLVRAGHERAVGIEWEAVESFSGWADELWRKARPHYPFIAVRDSATLNALYPREDARFIRLRVSRRGVPVGWAVAMATDMRGDAYFGNMRTGSIVDCLAPEGGELDVVYAARKELERRGADLIVSNQGHERWGAALENVGFLTGPSNFIFGASKELAAKMAGANGGDGERFLTRGDGDGPIHL